MILVFILFNFL